MSLFGIDVWGGSSGGPKNIDWVAIRDEAYKVIGADMTGFASVKCTDGMSRDSGYVQNLAGANGVGLLTFPYHVIEFGADALAQIKGFHDAATGDIDLPPCLDIETSPSIPPSVRAQKVIDCIKAVEDLFGVEPILYSYPGYLYGLESGKPLFDWSHYKLWIAHYFPPKVDAVTGAKTWLYGQKPNWPRWDLWQMGGDANGFKVPGITGYADGDFYPGTYDEFKALFGLPVAVPDLDQ